MGRLSRRTFLGSAATVTAALAGCSAGSGAGGDGSGGGDRSGTGSPTATNGASGRSSPGGPSSGTGGGGGDALRLQSLDVTGSPGGEIAVDPTGQPLLLDFFATWCAPCKPQMEHLRTVRGEFDDLRMRSITRETDRGAIADFWREYEGTWPVAMDPKLLAFEKYGVTRIPVLVVLDADGTEVWRHAGLASAESIRTAVEEARV